MNWSSGVMSQKDIKFIKLTQERFREIVVNLALLFYLLFIDVVKDFAIDFCVDGCSLITTLGRFETVYTFFKNSLGVFFPYNFFFSN